MRVVVDTNIWVSYLLKPSAPFSSLIKNILDNHVVVYSRASLHELAEVLSRDKFSPYLDKEDIRQFLNAFAEKGEAIVVTTTIHACRDPKDNMMLALAKDGCADMIITGDKDLLTLHPFEGIPIYNPADVLTFLS